MRKWEKIDGFPNRPTKILVMYYNNEAEVRKYDPDYLQFLLSFSFERFRSALPVDPWFISYLNDILEAAMQEKWSRILLGITGHQSREKELEIWERLNEVIEWKTNESRGVPRARSEAHFLLIIDEALIATEWSFLRKKGEQHETDHYC